MGTSTRSVWVAIRLLIVATVALGIIYPLAFAGIGKLFDNQANGSLVKDSSGQVVGSSLIGQNFTDPQWFHPRPSAAGKEGYDGLSSSGTNLGPNNPDLLDSVNAAKKAVAEEDGVTQDQVPPDAVTSSASGLDPDISPAYAQIQIARVAKARALSTVQVQSLVVGATSGRQFGFLGQARVNVLKLNLALEQLKPTHG